MNKAPLNQKELHVAGHAHRFCLNKLSSSSPLAINGKHNTRGDDIEKMMLQDVPIPDMPMFGRKLLQELGWREQQSSTSHDNNVGYVYLPISYEQSTTSDDKPIVI